jgi:hypothetical protein
MTPHCIQRVKQVNAAAVAQQLEAAGHVPSSFARVLQLANAGDKQNDALCMFTEQLCTAAIAMAGAVSKGEMKDNKGRTLSRSAESSHSPS